MSRVIFDPRSYRLQADATPMNVTSRPVPSGVRFVRFVSTDGTVHVRINESGNNYFTLEQGFASFEIPVREGASFEIAGEAGNENLRMYVR